MFKHIQTKQLYAVYVICIIELLQFISKLIYVSIGRRRRHRPTAGRRPLNYSPPPLRRSPPRLPLPRSLQSRLPRLRPPPHRSVAALRELSAHFRLGAAAPGSGVQAQSKARVVCGAAGRKFMEGAAVYFFHRFTLNEY
jgi:hypothetical protein